MALKVPDVGEVNILDTLRGVWNSTTVRFHLYQTNYTPVDGSVLGDFTEATFSGYAAIAVSSFAAATTVSNRGSTTANPITFTRGVGETSNSIYGYYVTDSTNTKLLFAERAPAPPISMTNVGDQIVITPVFTLSSEF